ncbi:MAG: ABC transporter permease [Polyangiaceae bacterium]|nr:ABC transporter permease [Polyangiaceae bacterium]
MKLASLTTLVRRDLFRTRGALATSGFGIAAGTAALVFFLALGLGVRTVLLGQVFPIDQVELEPPKGDDPGLLGLLFSAPPPGIERSDIDALRTVVGVTGVYPKLKLAFPSSARGGKELFGYDVGTSEMIADGIDPALVKDELSTGTVPFEDPLTKPGPSCTTDGDCKAPQYCEITSGTSAGTCSDPVPALVSRYLIEIFDKSLAPAHNLPPIGNTLLSKASGITFAMRLGESLLGKSKHGSPRVVRARVVGISKRAIDLGLTVPLGVAARWNKEFAGEAAANRFSSVIVQVGSNADTSAVLAKGETLKLAPKDTRARDVSVLISMTMGLLALVAAVIFLVSASNIAYTFRVLVTERKAEIALYRAVGASAFDMRSWMLALALVVGVAGGTVGLVVARLLALGADSLAASKLPDFPFKPSTFFAFPWWLPIAAVTFAALFAVLGAWGPARRAARVSPASALAGL